MFIVKYLEDKEKQNVKRNPWDPEIAHILVSSFNLLTLTPAPDHQEATSASHPKVKLFPPSQENQGVFIRVEKAVFLCF